jgi:CRP-like cAMP-binding protein
MNTTVLVAAAWHETVAAVIAHLSAAGVTPVLVPQTAALTPVYDRLRPSLVLVVDTLWDETVRRQQIAGLLHIRAIPWLLWNRSGNAEAALDAYRSGALAVLPADATSAMVELAVQNALARMATPAAQPSTVRRFKRGETIHLAERSALLVRDGVVAVHAEHHDGSQVLLGLHGPGQILLDHPDDVCHVRIAAHTDAAVVVQPWGEIGASPGFCDSLRGRVLQMEAWAAMQARPYLDQRLLGILSLLDEQFGIPHALGSLVDIRLTHTQLAMAVNATRATVTRTLRLLRTRGLLTTVQTEDGERFVLSDAAIEQTGHPRASIIRTSAHGEAGSDGAR